MFTARLLNLPAISTLWLLLCPVSAHAVIIAGTTATDNRTAPASTNLWPNVGFVYYGNIDSGGSGIYLGNRWVLTAAHVHGGNNYFNFHFPEITNSQSDPTYRSFATTGQWEIAPGGADLILFRLAEDPTQYSPGISSRVFLGQTPSIGTAGTMIGSGRNRESTLRKYNVSNPSDPVNSTWTETNGTGNYRGYLYDDTVSNRFAKRWGTNTTSGIYDGATYHTTYVINGTTTIASKFDYVAGANSEGQAAPGDSGGPLIAANNRLVGLMLYTGDYVYDQPDRLGMTNPPGQPAYPDPVYFGNVPHWQSRSAIFGNVTYYANLNNYADWIASTTRVHPSWDGDANFDGLVNSTDFNILFANYGTGSKWSQGDFNLDGTVDYKDYTLLQANFGRSDATGSATPELAPMLDVSSVPEPGLGLLAAGALGLLIRRRR